MSWAVSAAGIGWAMPHALRHSHALLIEQGEHPLTVARRLGHTSVRTVLDVYGHPLEGLDQAAAERLEISAAATQPKRGPKVVELKPKRRRPNSSKGFPGGR